MAEPLEVDPTISKLIQLIEKITLFVNKKAELMVLELL